MCIQNRKLRGPSDLSLLIASLPKFAGNRIGKKWQQRVSLSSIDYFFETPFMTRKETGNFRE
jgi:hypothetical protein